MVLGNYIDGRLKTQNPWFTFAGLVIGLIAGISILIRLLRKNDDSSDESD